MVGILLLRSIVPGTSLSICLLNVMEIVPSAATSVAALAGVIETIPGRPVFAAKKAGDAE